MTNTPRHLEFSVHTNPAHFNQRLEDILTDINNQLSPAVKTPPAIQKCKWVLTELVTNAYKHSGEPEVKLRVYVEGDELHIIKEDAGKPLTIHLPDGNNICWPLKNTYHNRELNIFHDSLNVLNARINEEGDVDFSVSSGNLPDMAARDNMNEHFGLIIIASVCKRFGYHYDAGSGKNIFTSVIKLDTCAI